MSEYQNLLDRINARSPEPITQFKRDEYCKLGSNGLVVLSRRKGRVQCRQILASGDPGYTFDLAPDVLAIRITRAEIDRTIELRKLEDIRPGSILDGLAPALNSYLAAVKQLDRE